MAGLSRVLLLAALSLSILEVLENLQNDLSGAIVRGHLSDDDRSRLLDINGVIAVDLGKQRNKKTVDEKELKSTVKEIEKLVTKQDFTPEDASKIGADLNVLRHRLSRR